VGTNVLVNRKGGIFLEKQNHHAKYETINKEWRGRDNGWNT